MTLKITITGARQQGKSTVALLAREALEALGVTVTLKGPSLEKRSRKEQAAWLHDRKVHLLTNPRPVEIECVDLPEDAS